MGADARGFSDVIRRTVESRVADSLFLPVINNQTFVKNTGVQSFDVSEATGGKYVIDASCNAVLDANGNRQYDSYASTRVSGESDHNLSSSATGTGSVNRPGKVYIDTNAASVGTSTQRITVNDANSSPTSVNRQFTVTIAPVPDPNNPITIGTPPDIEDKL